MMKRCAPLLLFTMAALPALSSAVELKNFRAAYGPIPYGATRTDTKVLPVDTLFVTYDIEGLKADATTGKIFYTTFIELFDDQAKALFDPKQTLREVNLQLGGTRMPEDFHVQMGRNLKAGKYRVRISVLDRLGKTQASHLYPFELLPPAFGMIAVEAPSIGFPGKLHSTDFVLTESTLDAEKQPKVEVTMRVLDAANKPVGTPVVSTLPRDLAPEANLERENFVPMRFPVFLNRPGRFTIDIVAKDLLGKKEARLTYPLTVIDLATGK